MTAKHTDSCPSWCVNGEHGVQPLAGDRMHVVMVDAQPLLTMEFENCGSEWEPYELLVEMTQHVREVEARIVIASTLPLDKPRDMQLTLDQAEHHARLVLELVRAARTNTPVDYANVTGSEEQQS
ncbi:hypothetical protein [Herbidospora daliensis]|uniref:hypothetical protein n=1 Tax=Herbidospora daliensis TaxID=295585 RepID=UPI0007836046|nr:hypothetical protein [Herbidospora daliensis]